MISVLILTKNEERDLPGCLDSVSWSDDVQVFDSHSTDDTTEIARALSEAGARLSIYPVDFIDGRGIDFETSAQLIARMRTYGEEEGQPADERFASVSWGPPISRSIVALENPLANPLAIRVALASDGVVLCVRRGRDRISAVRNVVHSLGKELIRCCVLLE